MMMTNETTRVATGQKIKTYLWFDNQAEEAVGFYTTLFPDSRVLEVSRYPEGGPAPAGTAMTVSFTLAGQEFIALNGGPQFKFTEAISLLVSCESQTEVDRLWGALTSGGGEESMCGWLKDRWGLSWQIIPNELMELLGDTDPGRAQRATQAMLTMRRIDVDALRRAADGV
jgi:predicted 3-demethylubiquinone-9 3-methyltransferase (glyoxalase superfamily)